MDGDFVESVTASLVREYLSKKGLKMTLQVMDEEMPRDENSISNRNHLRKVLQIDKIMNKNKESDVPLKAMLEVMSKSFMDKAQARSASRPDSARSQYPDTVVDRGGRPDTACSMYPDTVVDRGGGRPDTARSQYPGVSPEDDYNNSLSLSSSSSSAGSRLLSPLRDSASKTKSHKGTEGGDLVIDDDVDGETLLGDGRAGLLSQRAAQERLRAQSRSKQRGMSGPISASTNDRDRRSRMGRAKASPRPASSRKVLEPEFADPEQRDHTREHVTSPLRDDTPVQALPRSSLGRRDKHDSRGEEPIHDVLGVPSASRRPGSSRVSRNLSKEEQEDGDESPPGSHSPLSDSSQEDGTHLKPTDRSRSNLKSAHWRKKDDTLSQYGVSKSCIVSEITAKPVNFLDAVNNTKPKTTKVGDLEFGDIDDLDVEVARLDLRPQKPLLYKTTITDSRPIDIKTASELKKLCLGSASTNFNDEWAEQAFTFCDLPSLTYGIVQKKGGPCGLLAAVQACMLQQLFFCIKRDKHDKSVTNRLEVHPDARTEALAMGLADIFWRAGDEERAIVAIPSGNSIFNGNGRYRPDNLTETLVLNHFKNYEDLSNFIKDHIQLFEEDCQPGVVVTLYSAVLSRTIEKVRGDMDEAEGKLMGQHGYCTQEMVNLLLTGHAVSNTFNDYMMIDAMKLRGLPRRSNIGFLSLFEHYKSCEVGTYYKTPKYPIWVVCSESHFSVLFCLRKELISDWRVERRFDLYYYDGLGNQDEQIRLSVVTSNKHYRPPPEDDLTPPLELCIRTKWGEAEIDWNGTEPLL